MSPIARNFDHLGNDQSTTSLLFSVWLLLTVEFGARCVKSNLFSSIQKVSVTLERIIVGFTWQTTVSNRAFLVAASVHLQHVRSVAACLYSFVMHCFL